jgi:hypothetical protein
MRVGVEPKTTPPRRQSIVCHAQCDNKGPGMVAPRTFAIMPAACLLLGTSQALASLSVMAWAGTATAAEATVSVVELERLVQQSEEPQQRVQLLQTLQALIAVGDVVDIRRTAGLVEAVNPRTIRLRDLQRSVHIIPNSSASAPPRLSQRRVREHAIRRHLTGAIPTRHDPQSKCPSFSPGIRLQSWGGHLYAKRMPRSSAS